MQALEGDLRAASELPVGATAWLARPVAGGTA